MLILAVMSSSICENRLHAFVVQFYIEQLVDDLQSWFYSHHDTLAVEIVTRDHRFKRV